MGRKKIDESLKRKPRVYVHFNDPEWETIQQALKTLNDRDDSKNELRPGTWFTESMLDSAREILGEPQ